MANLKYGSTGDEVKQLQQALGFTGKDVDGIFGNKTHQAVLNFQKQNSLAQDGIVGSQTWGALNNAQNTAASTPATPATPAATAPAETAAPTFEHKPSDAVAQAQALLQQQLANKPGEWQGGTWTDSLNDTINQILNREKFSYDVNNDALYQQYKDQYTTQGKLAMMDTMGQAAALTGGYGSSYAQSVGQQAYQGYLQQLNEVVPELYGMALDQYNQEGQALYDQAALMAQMNDQEYGMYMDKLSNYYTELNYLTENARYMSETEYQQALDAFNIKYGAYRDAVGDQQWQSQFDEGVRQYNEQFAYQKEQDSIANASRSGGSGGVSDSTDGNGGYDTHGYTTDEIKALQRAAGITADGIWGPNTQKAYEAGYRPDGTGPEITDTDNARLFRSSIMTSSEFARHGNRGTVNGKTYTNYKSYIEACLADWTDNNVPHGGQQLTDQEVEFLMDYYGL